MTDWRWANFTEDEMACSHCGECDMDEAFMSKLQSLRLSFAEPMVVSSAYRCPDHPAEAHRARGGAHTHGKAVDVLVHAASAHRLLRMAMDYGFEGIGVSQKGPMARRFLHLDTMTSLDGFPRPTVWSY